MNKHEVIIFDRKVFVPTENSTESYYLINKIMSATSTSCEQKPGEYIFSQTIGYYRYKEKEHFDIDSEKIIAVLKECGYNEGIDDTLLPVVVFTLNPTIQDNIMHFEKFNANRNTRIEMLFETQDTISICTKSGDVYHECTIEWEQGRTRSVEFDNYHFKQGDRKIWPELVESIAYEDEDKESFIKENPENDEDF